MSRDAFACLFASAPIRDCGRPTTLEPVLASSWPVAVIFAAIAGLAVYAYLRAIYRRRIDWSRDRPLEWDVGSDERPTIEFHARRSGE